MNLVTAYNRSMRDATGEDGSVVMSEAAAHLADHLEFDEALRAEVAAFLLVHLTEPFGSASRELVEDVNGEPLEERVQRWTPSAEEMDEVLP